MAKFNHKFIEWSNKQEEKNYTFTITEADVSASRPRSGGSNPKTVNGVNKSNQSRSEGDLRKYQALPPIGSIDKKETNKKNKTRGGEDMEALSKQPVPPESFLLHLGVAARTHSIYEFHSNFPQEVDTFVIDRWVGPLEERFIHFVSFSSSLRC